MIRVLHSVSNMDRAGIETMIMNYYRHMDRRAVQFDFWANKRKPGAYEDEIAQLGGRVFRSPGFSPLKFPRYVREIKRAFSDGDTMIHVHNGALGMYALLAAKLCGVKVRIYHAHSTRIPPGSTVLLKKALKPFIRYTANKLLACGEASARFYYGNKRVKEGRCVFVHNAIEPSIFTYNADTRASMRKEHGLDGHTVIGHVGRMTAAKNHLRMLEIFKAYLTIKPDALLLLLGDGELEQSVREHAQALGITESVRFMGNVSGIERWYQAMDLFLMPSIFEGLPVVAIEAQAAGLPCVLSDRITSEVGISDLIRFISLDKSDDEWARSIDEAINASPERRDRTEDVRSAGYDISVEAPKLQALYEEYAKEAR